MGREWDGLSSYSRASLGGGYKRGRGGLVGKLENSRLLVPYGQLEQNLFRSGSVVGLLVRNVAPGSPEFDRIWIVGDGTFKNVNRALESWPPDDIPGNLSIPGSM